MFATIKPAIPALNLGWNTNTLATDGTLRVSSVPTPRPTIGSVSVSGSSLILRGSNGVPELHDIDKDGDLDLFVGDAGGRIAFFRNDGSKQAPRFVLASEDYLGRRVGRRIVPRFLNDVLIVGTERGGIDSTLGIRLPLYAAPAFTNVRGESTDVFVGGAGGGLQYFQGGPRSKE